ncbi:hypothetical protein CUMW_169380 [Citrus unshiu]|uniref:Uncharacterized protein n=1 Tax=Citrus unshiu TaxID=55188 RepID=A0A2H5PUS8_CITUN|nr:hypothetical protein CUMW_169380 [Citrus unshiu]
MGMTIIFQALVSLLVLALPQLLLQLPPIAAKSFSLELIHRDSKESLFYRGNLTFRKRIESYA